MAQQQERRSQLGARLVPRVIGGSRFMANAAPHAAVAASRPTRAISQGAAWRYAARTFTRCDVPLAGGPAPFSAVGARPQSGWPSRRSCRR